MSLRYNIPYSSIVTAAVVAQARVEIVSPRDPVWSISVRRIVGAATNARLHLGSAGDPISVRQGNRITFRDVPATCGIFLTTDAGGAGALVDLAVVGQANDTPETGPAFQADET